MGASDGDTQSIVVRIIDDSVIEGNETIRLKLTSTEGTAVLGDQIDHEMIITDNEFVTLLPRIRFSVRNGASIINQTGVITDSEWVDETFAEFSLIGLLNITKAIFHFDIGATITPSPPKQVDFGIYIGNGKKDVSDFGSGTKIETLTLPQFSDRGPTHESFSIDVTNHIRNLVLQSVDYVGFRFFNLVLVSDPTGFGHQLVLRNPVLDILTTNLPKFFVNERPTFIKGPDQTIWDDDFGIQSIANWATNISAGPRSETAQFLNFLISTDNDGLFRQIPTISGATGDLQYEPVPSVNGIATVSILLMDNGGTYNLGADTSQEQSFMIRILASSLPQKFSVNCGWNLISLNVHPVDMSPRSVFSDIIGVNGGSNILQKVVASMENFDPALPDELNTLTTLEDQVSYWIKVIGKTTFSVLGRQIQPDKHISLKAGWNNIGYFLQTSKDIRLTLADIIDNTNVEKVISNYDTFNLDIDDSLNSLKQLKPGAGYWIKVKEDQSFQLHEF